MRSMRFPQKDPLLANSSLGRQGSFDCTAPLPAIDNSLIPGIVTAVPGGTAYLKRPVEHEWLKSQPIFAHVLRWSVLGLAAAALAGCKEKPRAQSSAVEHYQAIMRGPMPDDAARVDEVFAAPGKYDFTLRLRDLQVYGLSAPNEEAARHHFRKADEKTVSRCISKQALDRGAGGIFLALQMPGCSTSRVEDFAGNTRMGSSCRSGGKTSYTVADATREPGRLHVRSILTEPADGYVVLDWDVAVSYRGRCEASTPNLSND